MSLFHSDMGLSMNFIFWKLYLRVTITWIIFQQVTSLDLSHGNSEWSLSAVEGETRHVVVAEKSRVLVFNFTSHSPEALEIFLSSSDRKVAIVEDRKLFTIPDETSVEFNITVRGLFIGRAQILFHVNKSIAGVTQSRKWTKNDNSYWYEMPYSVDIVVKRPKGILNTLFTVVVIVLVCLANIAMGCKTDITVVKETLKKPIAPATGLLSQFILMPLISFAVGQALDVEAALAFGLFATGCSPGGAASNIYTYYLDGNVSLSVTMTFVSTLVAVGMIPLWLFTLGIKVVYKTSNVQIPFTNIVVSLLGLIIPVGIGLLIQRKKPKWAKFIIILLRPVAVIFIIFVFTVGVYANLYLFKIITPLTLLAGALLPYCGFAFGGIVALLVCQKKSDILTIAIETGIQNSGIAIVLLQISLPPPDSDISLLAPVVASIFTPIPMVIAIVINIIRKKCFKKTPKEKNVNADVNEHEHNQLNGQATIALYENSTTQQGNDIPTEEDIVT